MYLIPRYIMGLIAAFGALITSGFFIIYFNMHSAVPVQVSSTVQTSSSTQSSSVAGRSVNIQVSSTAVTSSSTTTSSAADPSSITQVTDSSYYSYISTAQTDSTTRQSASAASSATNAATAPTSSFRPAQPAVQSPPQSRVDSVAEKYGAVGVQVAVIKNGAVKDTFEYGYATAGSVPMTSDHKIRVASLSKIVVGMNAMKMQEEGIVDIDHPISEYWGEETYQEVTLKQIFTHTSYLKTNPYVSSMSETLNQLKSSICFRTTNEWYYNNYALGIAGSTLEVAAGKTLDSYAKEKFFEPLGIDAAFNSGLVKNKAMIATLYHPNDTVARLASVSASMSPRDVGCNTSLFAGGLTISAGDLAKLTGILANNGTYDGQRYLSEQSVGRMETPYCTPWSRGHSFMQCVPLRLQTNIYGQSRMYYHLGIAYGTLSYMGYNPDTRDGVVIISTGASQSYDSRGIWCICAELADYFYNN